MRMNNRLVAAFTNSWARQAGLAFLLVALVSCGSQSGDDFASLPPSPLPTYGIGDSYQFSDGSTETVVATERSDVRWRGSDGSYVTSRDVLLPRLSWSNHRVQGERRIGAGPALLFPLQSGKSVAFTATRTVRASSGDRPVTTHENWHCNVAGVVPVTTQAGRFRTWRVDCAMFEQPGGMIQRSEYYAPDIGYYVRREEKIGNAPMQVVELTDYASAEPALPATAWRLRVTDIQQALESEVSGRSSTWRDAATGDAGDVQPLKTVQSATYGWCRDFAEHIRTAGRMYSLQGTGCRNATGAWDIVALEPSKSGRG
jgi:hypothetical protein